MNEEYEIESFDFGSEEKKEMKMKIYSKPEIIKLGAMQKVTLGGSVGTGDSANGDNNQCTLGVDC